MLQNYLWGDRNQGDGWSYVGERGEAEGGAPLGCGGARGGASPSLIEIV